MPYELGDGAGNALYPSTMFRIGRVDAPRALAAIGSFGAIDALMDEAAARYDFPRRGAILRPQRDPTVWRANVTQLRNAEGRAVDATDARQLSDAETEGRRQIVEYLRFLRAEARAAAKNSAPRGRSGGVTSTSGAVASSETKAKSFAGS